jgi:crossover junction endodeoxyribonuclease RuvC
MAGKTLTARLSRGASAGPAPLTHTAVRAPQSPILGIDPGLNRTGYAVFERGSRGPVLREGGVIRSTQKLSLAERVHEIGEGIQELIEQYAPAVMAIEQVFSTGQFPKAALLMAHARGAILFAAAQRRVHVVHYTPRQIKKLLTGSGKASKDQVQRAIQNELRLDRLLEPNDVADAAAVALCHFYTSRVAVNVS